MDLRLKRGGEKGRREKMCPNWDDERREGQMC